ncbi:MAG: ABC transporter substrate-binding protein [Candidatus Methanomethyliaceae archaeon]
MSKALRSLFLFVFVLTVGFLMVGCGAKDGAKQSEKTNQQVAEIKIGAIHPLTGTLAYEGKAIRNALELALEEVNASGGIKSMGGAKLKLIDGDDQGSPQKAVTEVQRLVKEGAVILTGCYTSGSTFAATQEAEKLKTPFIITIASAPNILERGFKYSFRIQPNANIFAQNFLDYIKEILKEHPDVKTAAIMHEDTLFGTTFGDYIEKHIGETGLKLVARVPYSNQSPNLTAEVTKVAAAKPDILIGTGYYRDQTLMVKTLKEQNVKVKAIIGIANGAFSDPKFIQEMGKDAEYIMDVNYSYNPKNPKSKEVIEKYQQKYGSPLSSHAVYGYVVGKLIADVLERAGSTDKEKIREALSKTNFADHILPNKEIKFNEAGENINAAGVITQIQNGKKLVVFPEEYAEAKLIFPMPQK